MKKLYTLLFIASAGVSFGQVTLPHSEHFDYAVGSNLGGQGSWVNVNTGDEAIVVANSLSYTGLASSSGNSVSFGGSGMDPQLGFTSTTSGVIYASYLLNVTDVSGLTFANGSYQFGVGTATSFASTVWIKPSTANDYFIGINKRTAAADAVYATTPMPINQTVMVVIAFDIDSQVSSMWLNPLAATFGLPIAPPASLTASTGGNVTTVDKVFLRQGSATDTPTVMVVDELRVGTTWASVTPGNLSVKENAIAGLKVYPNPVTNGVFYINTTANTTKDVIVYDVLGKQVIKTSTANAVNVSSLTSGVYIVKITEEGNTATRKLVIR